AFVGGSSIFGFVSPIRGTRYRYEGEAYSGALHFETALADWRKYFFFNPVTFAVRGVHYGRYGTDAEDPRLSPLYLGQSSLVRGYDIDSISAAECGLNPGAWRVFDGVVGSTVAVAYAEVRVPLFGTKEFGRLSAGLPSELGTFS